MRVWRLLLYLMRQDLLANIWMEGCDCYGPLAGVENEDGDILLMRPKENELRHEPDTD